MQDKNLIKTLFIPLILAVFLIPYASSLIVKKASPDAWNTNQTTKIEGLAKGESLGYSVSGAGDLNGDGFDDVILSAIDASLPLRYDVGTVYVLFGSRNGIKNVNLTQLTPSQGFRITGTLATTELGNSVRGAGDVNGDGIDDIIVGDNYACPLLRVSSGAAYVIFGKKTRLSDVDLRNLNSSQGIRISGANNGDFAGYSVSEAGDLNGDGINDFIIGAPTAAPLNRTYAGIAYVIFGSKRLSDIDLLFLTTTQGIQIIGATAYDELGSSVSGTGDINGDGIDDIIVGAPIASPFELKSAGIAYVIFGSRNGLIDIDLNNITSAQGAKINGNDANHFLGVSVSRTGDVNGDGINDLIVGANGNAENAGAAYVIFGNDTGFSDLNISSLPQTQGFKIRDNYRGSLLGVSVSGAGDVNRDGIDDIIVGASGTSTPNRTSIGAAYLILGSRDEHTEINVVNMTSSQGAEIKGENAFDFLGYSVSGAGDVNGDGFADVIVGAPGDFGSITNNSAGIVYIVMFTGGHDTLLNSI